MAERITPSSDTRRGTSRTCTCGSSVPKRAASVPSFHDRLVRDGHIKAPRAALRHRVARGDTLSKIARRYRTRVATLQALNKLKSSRIQAGQSLLIAPEVALRGAKDAVRLPPRRRPPPS